MHRRTPHEETTQAAQAHDAGQAKAGLQVTTKLADEYAYIRERMEKIEAETKGRVSGEPVASIPTSWAGWDCITLVNANIAASP